MLLDGAHVGGQSLLIIFHGGAADTEVTLPARGDGAAYRLVWDSVWERPPAPGRGQATLSPSVAPAEEGPVTLTAASVRVYSLVG
jgi:isoamylase